MLFFYFFKTRNIPVQSRHDERSSLLLREKVRRPLAEWHWCSQETESTVAIVFRASQDLRRNREHMMLASHVRLKPASVCWASFFSQWVLLHVTHTTAVWFRSAAPLVIDGWRKHLSEFAHLLCQKAQSFNSVNPWGVFRLLKFHHVCCCWPFLLSLQTTGGLFLCRPWKHLSRN